MFGFILIYIRVFLKFVRYLSLLFLVGLKLWFLVVSGKSFLGRCESFRIGLGYVFGSILVYKVIWFIGGIG